MRRFEGQLYGDPIMSVDILEGLDGKKNWTTSENKEIVVACVASIDCWQSVFLLKFQQGLWGETIKPKGEWDYHPVSPSSWRGQRHLRSRWLDARPSGS